MPQTRHVPSIRAFAAFAACALVACTATDESTGSESHFVQCGDDQPCPVGECVMGYCELDGEPLMDDGALAESPSGGDRPPNCVEVSSAPSTLEDAGVSPEELALGPATTTLTWDGSGWGDALDVEPVSGSSELTVSITVDEGNVRRIERQDNPEVGGTPAICEPLTEVRLQYRLTTADGSLDEQGETMHYLSETTNGFSEFPVPQSLTLSLDASALQGTLDIRPLGEGATARLDVALWWPAGELSGNISLTLDVPKSDGSVESSGQITFGSFSATGCGVQQYLTAPEDRFGENTIAEELALAEQPRTVEGRWTDSDETTTLTAVPRLTVIPLCRSQTEVLMAGTIALTSDDGRVDGLELAGTRRVWLPPGDEIVGSRGWIASGTFDCEAVDPWPFETPACVAGRKGVSVSYSGDQAFEVLQVYVYDSAPIEEGGPADSVVGFSTAP